MLAFTSMMFGNFSNKCTLSAVNSSELYRFCSFFLRTFVKIMLPERSDEPKFVYADQCFLFHGSWPSVCWSRILREKLHCPRTRFCCSTASFLLPQFPAGSEFPAVIKGRQKPMTSLAIISLRLVCTSKFYAVY